MLNLICREDAAEFGRKWNGLGKAMAFSLWIQIGAAAGLSGLLRGPKRAGPCLAVAPRVAPPGMGRQPFCPLRGSLVNPPDLQKRCGPCNFKPMKAIRVLVLFILALAMLPLPSELYLWIRAVVFVSALLCFWEEYKKGLSYFAILFLALMVLYNPFFQVHLREKAFWLVLDLGSMLLFAYPWLKPFIKRSGAAEGN